MSFTNIIGIAGVAMILLAYYMNTVKMIPVNGKLFYVMNTIGAALACYASILIQFWPFVVLESVWTLVSIYGLIRSMGVKMT